jgi:hypothetical protein
MKYNTFKVLVLSSLFVVMSGLIVYAEVEPRVIATIPFAFIVGNKTLPAGDYTIDRPDFNEPNVLLIRNANNHIAIFTNAESVQAKQMPNRSELIFNRIGDKYFLSKVWVTGDDIGCEIPKPRAERELELSASNPSAHTVTVQPTSE